VLNFDQTGLNITPTSDWTMDRCGASDVEIIAKEDKRQITCVLACTMTGTLLPPQLVYGGKTDRCHPDFAFPTDWDITHSENHWSNGTTMERYVEQILAPFYREARKAEGLPDDQWALCVLDVFKAHQKESVLSLFAHHRIKVVFVPPNCTGVLQPLDISGNGTFKSALKRAFEEWYAGHVATSVEAGNGEGADAEPLVKVDLRLSTLKPLHAAWVVRAWEALRASDSVLRNGWEKAGISKLF